MKQRNSFNNTLFHNFCQKINLKQMLTIIFSLKAGVNSELLPTNESKRYIVSMYHIVSPLRPIYEYPSYYIICGIVALNNIFLMLYQKLYSEPLYHIVSFVTQIYILYTIIWISYQRINRVPAVSIFWIFYREIKKIQNHFFWKLIPHPTYGTM